MGGSTRIPKVQNLVKEFFNGKESNIKVNPDEAVAFGAAIQADILSNNGFEILLIDVNSLALGVRVSDGSMSELIPSNTVISTKASREFTTVDDYQKNGLLSVYEGEHKIAENNHFLDEFTLEGIELALANIPKFIVTFEIDADGLLKVSAVDLKTGSQNGIIISKQKRTSLTEEEIIKMKQDLQKRQHEEKLLAEKED